MIKRAEILSLLANSIISRVKKGQCRIYVYKCRKKDIVVGLFIE